MAQIPIYVTPELKLRVEQVAIQEERSVSYVVRKWIERALAEYSVRSHDSTRKQEHQNHSTSNQVEPVPSVQPEDQNLDQQTN